MPLATALTDTLRQLQAILPLLRDEEYQTPVLLGSSVGQHVRHVIELLEELHQGYAHCRVCYDERRRDPLLESDRQLAHSRLEKLATLAPRPDKPLVLDGHFDTDSPAQRVYSSWQRELAFNLDHAVHHMALIRVALESRFGIALPATFGVAAATQKQRRACAH